MPPLGQKMARAASPLPQAQRPDALPSETARELPGALHLHLHGASAEDVTEVLRSCGARCGKPHPAGTGTGPEAGPGGTPGPRLLSRGRYATLRRLTRLHAAFTAPLAN